MKSFGILLAAGQSRRMGRLGPKLWLQVGGRPIIAWSLWYFAVKGKLDQGVVVARLEDLDSIQRWLETYRLVNWVIVSGSEERYLSVQNGLEALNTRAQEEDIVLIHDAARIMVPFSVIDRVGRAAELWGAAMPALAITDTVKKIQESPDMTEVIDTVPRHTLRFAQTPQGFRYGLIREAHRSWMGGTPTDDSEVVERAGHRVCVVFGDPDNRKLTTPEDLKWFEWRLGGI